MYNSDLSSSDVIYVQGATNGGGTTSVGTITSNDYIQLTSNGFKARPLAQAQGFTVNSLYYYAWK